MENFGGINAMSGRKGKLIINGLLFGEAYSVYADESYQKEPVQTDYGEDFKVSSIKRAGEFKMYKVNSVLAREVHEAMEKGEDIRFTLISSQPNGAGNKEERIALYGVCFDKNIIIDWARNKITDISVPFTYARSKFLDTID